MEKQGCLKRLIHVTTIPLSLHAIVNGQVRYMQEKGFSVSAVSSPGVLLEKFGNDYHVEVYSIEMCRAITPIRDLRSLFLLVRLFRKIKPDIIHAHTPKAGLLGTVAGRIAGVPACVYQVHGLRYSTARGMRRRILMLAEQASCKLAHKVFSVSKSIRDVAIADGICTKERIQVIGCGTFNGVDAETRFNPSNIAPETVEQLRTKLRLPQGAIVLGFVGRIVREKGIVELLEAWKAMKRQHEGLRLLLVGPLEAHDQLPKGIMKELQDDPKIQMPGYVSNDFIANYLALMDILILPSFREGFGLVLLEAAAMELPVIASRINGCVDAVEHGITGTLIQPGSIPDLISALQEYLANPEMRKKHGLAGRSRALRDFKPQAIWEKYYREYLRMLGREGNS